ncbi:MAG: glycerol-3-phosphate acyltransferase [Legionellales bacterium]|nr:glycerol-3-phosphate acyltransferase [Legionellales bacterium]|tara:strand:- start:9953 stop:10552 length:600 start_codon:yes stop_codon:yes gene_type:complete
MLENTLFIVAAYLLGSISSAIVVCKVAGLPDPRTEGSKNPGATNVLRVGGKLPAIITLLGDVLKGVIPVLAAKLYGIDGLYLALVACGAFLGHLFPLFFKFQGGKGVATAFGAIIALAWPVGLAALATWLVVAILFRYSSLAALVAALSFPIYAYYLAAPSYVYPLAGMSLVLIIRHHGNIRRLVTGTESKINFRKKAS